MFQKNFVLVFAIATTLLAALPPKKKITVWMCGDSTMSIKDTRHYPETGWGMPFVHFWDSTVAVVNKAKNGRSTQSFIDEGLWKSVIDNLSKDDYVFIQFGHNDEVPTKKTYTTPAQYKTNLARFITESRVKGAIPVLLTPVSRRRFDSTGLAEQTHPDYSRLVRETAAAHGVVLLDMDSLTKQLYQQMGVENSKLLFLHLKPGQHPNYPGGKEDNTHFNEYGARRVAELVLEEIRKSALDLKERIVKRN